MSKKKVTKRNITYQEIQEQVAEANKTRGPQNQIYTSRTREGICANECDNRRRNGSKYCQECSDKHNGKNN